MNFVHIFTLIVTFVASRKDKSTLDFFTYK